MKMAESYCALLRASCRHSLKNLSMLEMATAVVGAPTSTDKALSGCLVIGPGRKNNGVFGAAVVVVGRADALGVGAPPMDATA